MLLRFQVPLVPTKMVPPQLLPTWVERPRLNTAFQTNHARLVLVIAPAGFGKSTAVAQWLFPQPTAATASPVAWLTLDEYDQDGTRFLVYLVGAIERVAPGTAKTTLPLLDLPAPPPPFVIAQALLADLSALPYGLTLVLDDYHSLTADAIHKIVAYLLRHLPPLCRLVLISRAEPPLPLARLRAEQQLLEVGTDALRFTAAETVLLFAIHHGTMPDTEHVVALQQQTEGWVLALQLAALAQIQRGSVKQISYTTLRQIATYLVDEVVAQQDAELQAALFSLTVPERFCAGLCGALLGTPHALIHAERLIEQMVTANLFLIPLDEVGYWYRFHHLFREILLQRLQIDAGAERLRELQLRAARWFASEGMVDEAVRLYLAASDEDSAAALIERVLPVELSRNRGSARSIHWLRLLPSALIMRRPGLTLLQARIDLHTVNLVAMTAGLAHVETLFASPSGNNYVPSWPTFWADRVVLQGLLHYYQHRPASAIPALKQALEQPIGLGLDDQAIHMLGRSYVAAGRYEEGVEWIEQRHITFQKGGTSWQQIGDLTYSYAVSTMHAFAGDLHIDPTIAEQVLQLSSAKDDEEFVASYATIGYVIAYGKMAYERADFRDAAVYFQILSSRKYRVSYTGYMFGVVGLAQLSAAQGAFAEADSFVQEAQSFANDVGSPFLQHQAASCATLVALMRGDVPAALESSQRIEADMHLGLSAAMDSPRLTQILALIMAGDAVRLSQADTLLTACFAEIEQFHNIRLLLRALALQALLRQAQGRSTEALASLERAIVMAAPFGFVRTFVDLGPGLFPLLQELAAHGDEKAYVAQLLQAYQRPTQASSRAEVALPASRLPEMLTRREIEILGLLAERWSDKEIAAHLVIAPGTVRKHTSTIYDKLGVGRRREAVAAARALGLLPAS